MNIDIIQLNDELTANRIKPVPREILPKGNPLPESGILFECYFDTVTKKFLKIYNKNVIWRESTLCTWIKNHGPFDNRADYLSCKKKFVQQFDTGTEVSNSKYDMINWMPEILKSNKHDILPEIVFDTTNYIGIEWMTTGWRVMREEDLVSVIGGIPLATKLLKSVMRQVIDFQLDNLLDSTDIELQKALYKEYIEDVSPEVVSRNPELIRNNMEESFEFTSEQYKPCVSFTDIDTDDFLISDDKTQIKYPKLSRYQLSPRMDNSIWMDGGTDVAKESYDRIYDIDAGKFNIMLSGKRHEIIL